MCKKVNFLFCLVLVLGLVGNSFGQIVWDDGGADHLWKTPENWDTDKVPTDVNDAEIVRAEPNGCIIDASHTGLDVAEANNLAVGASALSGDLRMTGGSLTVADQTQVGNGAIGRFYMQGGTFTMTNADDRLTVGNSAGTGLLDMQAGTLDLAGGLRVANGFNTTGDVNMVGGTITVDGVFCLGYKSGGAGTLTMQGGVVDVAGNMELGNNGGIGTLDMQGGTVTVSGDGKDLKVGFKGIGDGTINMQGGTLDVNDAIHIGSQGVAVGAITVVEGNLIAGKLQVGRQGGTGTLDVQGGLIDVGGTVAIGYTNNNTPGTGTMTMTGGQIDVTDGLNIGSNGSTGNLQLGGGTITADSLSIGADPGGNDSLTMTDGSVTITDGAVNIGQDGGTGTVTIQGGAINTVMPNKAMNIGKDGGSGTLNMDGGTLTSAGILKVGPNSVGGTLNMTAGAIEVGSPDDQKDLTIGDSNGIAEVNMVDGTIYVSKFLIIGTNGHLQLDGGIIEAGKNNNNDLQIESGGSIDITGGKLIFEGGKIADEAQAYFEDGLITAYDVNYSENPRGITVEYDSGTDKTTVRAISAEELLLAWKPGPSDGAGGQAIDVNLIWSPGELADNHDVYFGTDETNVTDANRDEPLGVLVSQDRDANSYDPGVLDLRETYFWRIDEVNDPCVWKGRVWEFTVGTWVTVDDFESYDNDFNRIYFTWHDGYDNDTGSIVYLSTDNANTGAQSMRLYYDNTSSPYYSEVDRDVNDPNWTRYGVKALSIKFYGEPDNDPNETIYVALEDGDGRVGKVTAEIEPNALSEASWTGHRHRIDIALQEFVNANSVDLTDIRNIAIGIGDGSPPTAPGYGQLYIDDIRLHVPRCLRPNRKKNGRTLFGGIFAGFTTGDCYVDSEDLDMMVGNWLEIGEGVENDPFDDGEVNFKDYSVLADRWLKEEQVWP